jgi:hypothetical protein
MIAIVCTLNNTDHEVRLNFVNWYRHRVHKGELYHTLHPLSGKVWLHISGYVNCRRNSITTLIHKVPLCDKVNMWCVERK